MWRSWLAGHEWRDIIGNYLERFQGQMEYRCTNSSSDLSGSHCASMLVRSGLQNLKLVDFDDVTVSSLNRLVVSPLLS